MHDEHDQLHQLSTRLDRLEAENQALRERLASSPAGAGPDTPSISRRALVTGSAAVVAGTLASVASGDRAAAAPAAVILDEINDSTNPTVVRGPITELVPDDTNILTGAFSANNTNATQGTGLTASGPSYGIFSASPGVGVFTRSDGGGTAVYGWVDGDPVANPPGTSSAGVRGHAGSQYPTVPAFLATGTITLRSHENAGGVPASAGAEPGDLTIRRQADGSATWWVCVQEAVGPTAARFVRVAAPESAGTFETLPSPIRVYDARPGELPLTGPKVPLVGGVERVIDCTANTGGAVPSDATAVVINLAATGGSSPGYIGAYPAGAVWGGTASLNFNVAEAISNSTTVGCGTGAEIALLAGDAGTTVDVVVDVIGFYR